MDAIAPYLAKAFSELYARKYSLEPMNDGAADMSNEVGNTSSFKCRAMTGGDGYSLHSFGLAVDVNVSRNPYIGSYEKNTAYNSVGNLIPKNLTSLHYLDRTLHENGMNEAIVDVMKKYGFLEWGGNWEDRIDYMHFQVPTNVVYNIVRMDKRTGEEMVNLIIQFPDSAKKMSQDTRWIYLYNMQHKSFMVSLKKYFPLLKTENENKVINLVYENMVARGF
jgi:hypothetical protein